MAYFCIKISNVRKIKFKKALNQKIYEYKLEKAWNNPTKKAVIDQNS